MALTATSYFNGLKTYMANDYKVKEASGNTIELVEKIYYKGSKTEANHKVTLNFKGNAFAIKLDKYDKKKLFHFLETDSKPWAKRCDFVVFHCYSNKIRTYCMEFKSGSFPSKLKDQLDASSAWCHTLHSTIKHYTGKSRKIQIEKYVLSCHPNASNYLDDNEKYLKEDHTIRHYLYDDIEGMNLEDLEHSNYEVAK